MWDALVSLKLNEVWNNDFRFTWFIVYLQGRQTVLMFPKNRFLSFKTVYLITDGLCCFFVVEGDESVSAWR